ncbi:MAG: hypothetical protein IT464_12865 [Planctomycetes bacterium]|nr:hypothetical protein [Planctomycetota bacterium]
MKLLPYSKGMPRGFSVTEVGEHELRGRYVYRQRDLIEEIDEETLDWKPVEKQRCIERNLVAPFAIDFARGIIRVSRSGDFGILFDAIETLPGVHVSVEPLNVNLQKLHDAFSERFRKTRLAAMGIAELLHDDTLVGSADFKLLDEGLREKLIDKYGDKLKKLTFKAMTKVGIATMKLTSAGTISYSEDEVEDPETTRMVLENMVLGFHEAEVETVADQRPIAGPAAAKAKAGRPDRKKAGLPMHITYGKDGEIIDTRTGEVLTLEKVKADIAEKITDLAEAQAAKPASKRKPRAKKAKA